jgi:hypothetical protein
MRNDIGRADAGGELVGPFGKHISRLRRIPCRSLSTQSGRPHQIQRRDKSNFDINPVCALYFVVDKRSRFVERNEEAFANHKVRSCVDPSDGFWTINDSSQD